METNKQSQQNYEIGSGKVEKKKCRRKFFASALATSSSMLLKPSNAMRQAGVKNNVNLVRTILKIPSKNFDSFAAKQLTTYKHSQAQAMFRERNKKFTCVSEPNTISTIGQDSETEEPRETGMSIPTCSLDLLNERERQAIRNYEESQLTNIRNTTIDSIPIEIRRNDVGKKAINSFSTIPAFDPHVPPPPFLAPQQQKSNNKKQQRQNLSSSDKKSPKIQQEQRQEQQHYSSTSNSAATCTAEIMLHDMPTLNKEVKTEVVEFEDEMPLIQDPSPTVTISQPVVASPSSSSAAMPAAAVASVVHPIKTESQFIEDEEKKNKQALLWSVCQTELTIQSSIEKTKKRIEEYRSKVETYTKAIAAEEKLVEQLQQKANNLVDRRKELLLSVYNRKMNE